MGKIGKKVRQELGLIDRTDDELEVVDPPEVGEEVVSLYDTKTIGLRRLELKEGVRWQCVVLKTKGDKVVDTEVVSPEPRKSKGLVLEDFKIHSLRNMHKELYDENK